MSFPTPRRIAFASARRPKTVVMAWAAVLVAAFVVIGALMSGATTSDVTFTNNPTSQRGKTVLEQRFGISTPADESVVVRAVGAGTPADVRANVNDIVARIHALDPGIVDSVTSPFAASAPPGLVRPDGRTAVIPVVMSGDINQAERNIEPLLAAAQLDTPTVVSQVAGAASARKANSTQAEHDLKRGELMIGLPVAIVILFLVFRALGAMVLPLSVAFSSIIVATAGAAIIGSFWQLSFFVSNMITMMGLAVGIDYALFVVSRYREERAAGREVLESVDVSSATSGRAVGYSGIAVAVALAGLLIVPSSIYVSLALGAMMAVLVAVAASMTLLPAMLRLMGDRIEWGGLTRRARRSRAEDRQARGFASIARAVMRRPVVAAVVGIAIMGGLAAPYVGINTGANGIESLPRSTDARQAFDVLQQEYGVGTSGPITVTLEGDVASAAGQKAITDIRSAMRQESALGTSSVVLSPDGGAAAISAPLNLLPASRDAANVVDHLSGDVLPAATAGTGITANITGEAAFNADYFNITDRYLIPVVSVVLLLSFIVLLIAFRSLVVPLVAILMNLLSVGAAYGLMVLVFQHGFGVDLLGFQQTDVIDAWIPLFLFAVLFGLSMDYHVFLISRIREQYDRTGDTAFAVEHGVASSARLITGAAAIMVAVFGGFAMGELVMFQQMGFGLAVAILLDATLVRTVLVPAVMRLLGDANWYLPKALEFLPKVDLEGASQTH